MTDWLKVPRTLATRERARQLREQAVKDGCDVLDFSETDWISATAADELVCNGDWTATTGESSAVREVIVRVQARRGRRPCGPADRTGR